MTAKTVLIVGHGPDAVLQRAVLATLPNDYHAVSEAEGADIVLVSGRDGTADLALDAAEKGRKTVFVTSPSFLGKAQRVRLGGRDWVVWVALAYGASLVPAGWADGDEAAILDLTACVRDATPADLTEALLAQVALGRMLAGGISSTSRLLSTPQAVVLEATAPSGLRWRMTAQAGLRNTLSIDRVARNGRGAIVQDLDPHARPAVVTLFDEAGAHVATPIYQSHYRHAWSAALQHEQGAPYTLEMLEADLLEVV